MAMAMAMALACSRTDATAPPVTTRDAAPRDAPKAAAAEPPDPGASEAGPNTTGALEAEEPSAPPPTETPDAAPGDPPPSIDDAKGMATEALVAAHGEPDETQGDRWIYRYPRDAACVDREIVYTLTVRGGTVTAVKRATRQTGKHCEPPDMP